MARLVVLSSVTGIAPNYTVKVDDTSDFIVGDHLVDAAGLPYRVASIVSATQVAIVDDVQPNAPEGLPTLGAGAVYTPTANLRLSQAPHGTNQWDNLIRRDLKVLDTSAAVSSSAPQTISDSTNTAGTATQASRADHVHAHGDRSGGTLHALASSSVAGFMSASDKTKLDFSYTTAPLTYYVQAGGSDSNDGLSVGTAFATVQKAIDSTPKYIRHPVTVNVGAGNFAGFAINDFQINYVDPNVGGFLMISGTLQNSTVATGTAAGTVTSAVQGNSSTNTFAVVNDTTQSWTVNNLVGKFFVTTGGTGAGQTYPITANTSTQVTVCTGFITTVPDVTTTYAIQEPGTVINTVVNRGGGAPTPTPTAGGCIYVSDVKSSNITSVLYFRFLKIAPPSGAGVRSVDTTVITFANNIFSPTGSTSNLSISGATKVSAVGNVFTTTGSSVHISIGSQSTVPTAGSYLQNLFQNGFGLLAGGIHNCGFSSNRLTGCSIGIEAIGQLFMWQVGSFQLSGCTTGIIAGLTSAGTGTITMQISNPIDISGSGTAISLGGGPSVIICAGGFLTGTGNTTGLALTKGAQVQYNASSTLTGTTEISMDGVNTTVAALRGTSPRVLTTAYGTTVYE